MTTASDTSALPARQRPSVGLLLANAASLALVVWIGVDHTSLGLEVRGARVVALSAMPLWPLYALSVAAAAGLGVFVVIELLRRRPPDSRSYRLLPIAAVVFFAMHFLVLPPALPPMPSDWLAASWLSALESSAVITEDGLLPRDPEALAKQLSQMPPPYLRDGKPMTAWPLVVRSDCDGPISALPAALEPATLIACVSADRRTAWVSIAGTGGRHTGPATLVMADGAPFSVKVQAMRREELPALPFELNAQASEEEPEAALPEE